MPGSNLNTIGSFIRRLSRRIPLNIKMMLITLVVGLAIFVIMDSIQTRKLKGIFQAELAERLDRMAINDRANFDRYKKTHYQAIKLFMSQKRFSDYIESQRWSEEDAAEVIFYRKPPPWFPSFSVLRAFAQPRYAILLDSHGKVREVYQSHPKMIPSSLLNSIETFLVKSNGQNYLTNIDGNPYLLTSKYFDDSRGKQRATLMFASPLDDEFLIASMNSENPGHIVALVTPGENPEILTSSNLEELPSEISLNSLQDQYLVAGEGFFDYGSSDLAIKLVSLMSMKEVEKLTRSVIIRAQKQRVIESTVIILTFAMIMFWITRRIQRLTRRIIAFSRETLGGEQKEMGKGDQLHALEDRFRSLTSEVLETRDALKREASALEHLALHDALTGLPNRLLLHDRLEQAIFTAQRDNKLLALLMMDLDRFKEINDTLGHNVGDMVLKAVGARLPDVLRKSDTVARLGGDEFMILLPSADFDHAKDVAAKLINVLEPPIEINNNKLYVGASIGIVTCPENGEDTNTLIQRADVAMYVAKHTGCGISSYDPGRDHYSADRLILMGDLRHAIEEGKLEVCYQPKVSYETGQVIGVEALVRWPHPEHGLILPDDFIPLAEHTGLIQSLTTWVLNASLRQCCEWHANGIDLSISINLSTRNLHDLEFPDEVASQLEKWGIPPEKLVLEITESAMMSDPARGLEVLKLLDAIGVRLSIDDFGTGYSCLAYLKNLPVDELKIDKSFVMHMEKDGNDAAIIHSTIDLAHNLDLKVVAEGVETEEALDMLKNLGCDESQGYHISRPLYNKDLLNWIRKSPWGLPKKTKEAVRSQKDPSNPASC